MIRDGRDGAVSGWFHGLSLKGQELDEFQRRFPDLPSYVEVYVRDFWIPYIKSARSIVDEFPQRYFEVRYETLHIEPEPLVRNMLRFLAVDDSKGNVTRCIEGSTFGKLSGGRKRGQVDPQSFYRKGIVGDRKNYFDEHCTEVFMKHGGAMLRELGYE